MKFDYFFSLDWETMAKQLPKLSEDDARALSEFFDCLLSDVICQQVLPDAVKRFSKTFGISFKFKPQLIVDNNNPDACSARIDIDVSHPMFPDMYVVCVGKDLFSSISLAGISCPKSDMHQQCMLQLSLLDVIFSSTASHKHEWCLSICYGVLNSECPFAVYNKMTPETTIFFHLKPFNCLEDLLAGLLSDRYDLTPIQPFLAVS